MDEGHVLVIGSAGIDVKGRPTQELEWETSNLGRVRNSVGGVARNIAENLARLEVETILLTAVGKDNAGRRVIHKCEDAGINCARVQTIPQARTGTYLALLTPKGDLMTAISDFAVIQHVNSDYLRSHEDLFAEAAMVVLDATLSPDALATAFELTTRHQVRICVDPTTPALALNLCQYIDQMYMVSPNAAETTALCGLEDPAHDYESATNAARQLVAMGAKVAVVTLGEKGLAYADGSGGGHIPAISTRVVDPTGAGDAFSGAVIFGLLNEVPLDEALRLGVTAASLTLQSPHTVLPHLSQEMLYNQLAI
ncbi:MAG: carbohydrate kinase family protein [Anaerolineae bacterium]|nr:carbohydrate kinase family protein [Anaerolineae bacterium]